MIGLPSTFSDVDWGAGGVGEGITAKWSWGGEGSFLEAWPRGEGGSPYPEKGVGRGKGEEAPPKIGSS